VSVELRAPARGTLAGERRAGPGGGGQPELWIAAAAAAVALVLALASHAYHGHAVPGLLRGAAAGLVFALLSGDALAVALVPRGWRRLAPIFALALGMPVGGLVLTALGLAHVPLHVSLWLALAAGACASVLVRRHERRFAAPTAPAPPTTPAAPTTPAPATGAPRSAAGGWRRSAPWGWLAVLFVVFCVALAPAARTADDTIYGTNPDASQVVGIAVLFQHDPPTATDYSQPLNVVPHAWRFRYPIFYPLAAASSLAHFDPIAVFPALAALLVVIAAFGFGMLAVELFDAPRRAGPAIGAAIGFSWVSLHLAWHPYWNQLWGYALLPYALLFGWRAIDRADVRAAVLCVVALVSLWLAYPLALPYPLVILIALILARWRAPRMPSIRGARAWGLVVLGLAVLAPAVGGASLKLAEGISQLVTPSASLWGGDVKRFMPFDHFVGTTGGFVGAVLVALVAAWALRALDRRRAIALGVVLSALCLLDVRFRASTSGTYMDFKHLSFVAPLVLVLALSAVARLLLARSRASLAAGAALALAWTGAALVLDRREVFDTGTQVTPAMLKIRQWAARLPRHASVRVDIPPSGLQLWAVFLLGSHPVDTLTPVLGTTYAYAPFGGRADYSLATRYRATAGPLVPAPRGLFTVDPPVAENSQFVLRRIALPPRYAHAPATASRHLVP
jgi:hypothetical protein